MSQNQNGASNEDNSQNSVNNDNEKAKKPSVFKKRSFRYGSLATAFTVIFIALVVLLNVVLNSVNTRVSLGVDLTKGKTYALSSQTIKYLGTVNKSITIYVLATEKLMLANSDYAETVKILQQYPMHNGKIDVKFIDLDANPTFASKYPDETLSQADLIVTDGNKYKHIASTDYFETTYDSSYNQVITGYKAEDAVDSAIAYLSSTNLPKVVFTSGHNEADSTGLATLLKSNNYQISSQNIGTVSIASDVSTIAIYDPANDFSADEINKLDTFLTNGQKYGKNLMVFFDPRQKALPNLESYLKEWGIEVGKGAVYDSTGYSTFQPLAGTLDASVITSTTTSVNSDLANARPLTLLFDEKDIRKTIAVVKTTDTSKLWNPSSNISSATFKESASDQKGPFTVLALGTKTGDSGKSNVLVSGSTDIANSTLLTRSDLNNDKIIVDSVNYIAGFKTPITISSKTKDSNTLSFTTPQTLAFVIIFVLAVPLLMLALALITFLRRRHL